ncbi:MAG: gamma-glutamyl-gamma-aminobutyrate hydrolase family protein [Polyangiaceae bacterium]|nr:gamma-glutamyl-gamma-aminobutyrate hydrolase family protein [Polyangiaceae bacterium]
MSAAGPIAILVTGEPVPDVRARSGSFAAMIARTVGDAWPHGFVSFDVREAEGRDALARLPTPPAALIITGSAAHVPAREPWILACEALLRPLVARGVPTLGLCFGHQLLAQALGGEVAANPAGR